MFTFESSDFDHHKTVMPSVFLCQEKPLVMTAFVDSQAVFESRIKHAGLSDDIKDKLVAGGIVNMSQLAFISSYTPGSGDETPLIAAFEALLIVWQRRRALGVSSTRAMQQ